MYSYLNIYVLLIYAQLLTIEHIMISNDFC